MPSFPYQDSFPLNVTLTAARNVRKGEPVRIGDTVVIAAEDGVFAANTARELQVWAPGMMMIRGVTKTGAAWTVGAKLYVTAAGAWTVTAGGNALAGIAASVESAASTSGSVLYAPIIQT